ncbi:hypothetical protein [Sinosporangium siamense]|uniref:Uncharacterized protein n=1 Tax=Sinosporangium siamense TaxID=1367973 RepID=A0A919RHG7_9ACTN|nr:hypothetical protein [Sinosporangium siamense]GII93928.1 hypothetical protein Ssi02_41590 [Sinosporangium siamense]
MRGEILWAHASLNDDAVTRLLNRIKASGLHFEHPVRAAVAVLGEEGLDFLPAGEVRGALAHVRPIDLKFWLDPDTDVVLAVARHREHDMLNFDLDGLTTAQAQRVAATILWAAISDASSLGLVADTRLGDTRPYWEDFLLSPPDSVPTHGPDLLWRPGPNGRSTLTVTPASWPIA